MKKVENRIIGRVLAQMELKGIAAGLSATDDEYGSTDHKPRFPGDTCTNNGGDCDAPAIFDEGLS